MTITDILILVGLLFYIALGFRDGFFKKVFAILGVLGGLIAAAKFFPTLGDLIKDWLDLSVEVAYATAFFLLFTLISVILNLFYRWFGRSGSETQKLWSRLIGALFGGIQGAVVISLILYMFSIFDEPDQETKEASYVYKPILDVAPLVFDYTTTWVPESKDFLQTLEENFHPKQPAK